jgi:chemotaxis protein CheX
VSGTFVPANRENLRDIVTGVLVTMADYEVYPTESSYVAGRGNVTSSISFAGLWKAIVLVETPLAMACRITSAIMRVPLPDAFNDDVADAMGELANVIGGNLKALLPTGVILSMPTVVEGNRYSVRVCGGNSVTRLAFAGPDGIFFVTFVEVPVSFPVGVEDGDQPNHRSEQHAMT